MVTRRVTLFDFELVNVNKKSKRDRVVGMVFRYTDLENLGANLGITVSYI